VLDLLLVSAATHAGLSEVGAVHLPSACSSDSCAASLRRPARVSAARGALQHRSGQRAELTLRLRRHQTSAAEVIEIPEYIFTFRGEIIEAVYSAVNLVSPCPSDRYAVFGDDSTQPMPLSDCL